jgi:regulatory protein
LLAAHDRSAHEIRTRLSAAGIADTAIARTLQRLRELRYLDDRRFANGAAEQSARRGYGSAYVRAQLAAKGVADGLIDEAVHAAFDDEPALARRALTRRYPDTPSRPQERMRAVRFLLRRGFPEEVVFAILGEYC